MYGIDLSDEENAENVYKMFVNLPAEVITQGVSMIHVDFSKFFRAEYFNDESKNNGGPLSLLSGIKQCFIDIPNRCVRAIDEVCQMNYQDWSLNLRVNDLRHQRVFGHKSLHLRGKLSYGNKANSSSSLRRKTTVCLNFA
jgi:hypothetical protein